MDRFSLLAALAIGLAVATLRVIDSNNNLEIALRNATALRLNTEAQATLSGTRPGGQVSGVLKLLAAHRISPDIEIEGEMGKHVRALQFVEKIVDLGGSGGEFVAFADHDTRIVAKGPNGRLQQFDARTGKSIDGLSRKYHGRASRVALGCNGTRMVSTENGTLWLWNGETGKLHASKEKLGTMVLSLAFNHDCTRIVSGDMAGALQLWNETLDRIGEPVKGHWVPEISDYQAVSSVAFNHDSARIVSGGYDGAARLWNATTLLRIGDPMRAYGERMD